MHPKYKTKYRVGNWAEYDRALVRRGDVTLWLTPDAIATWAAAGVGSVPGFPDRLRENPPRQGFFEHPEYLVVRAHLPAPWQDILDLAYYSGWPAVTVRALLAMVSIRSMPVLASSTAASVNA